MKRIALAIVGVIAVLILGLMGFAAMQPDSYQVSRSRVIHASATQIRPYLQNMQSFLVWSPWDRMEPNIVHEFSTPPDGVGAYYTWIGNETGRGRMTVTSIEGTDQEGSVSYALRFMEPFESNADVNIAWTSRSATETEVVWSMSGDNDFMGKIFSLFMNMDSMIGNDFERGLGFLAEEVEASP